MKVTKIHTNKYNYLRLSLIIWSIIIITSHIVIGITGILLSIKTSRKHPAFSHGTLVWVELDDRYVFGADSRT